MLHEAADESGDLRKPTDLIHLSTVRASGVTGFHLHHRALDIVNGNDGAAFVAAEFAHVGNDLNEAAAAVGTKKLMRD